jgi:hypothetical protein
VHRWLAADKDKIFLLRGVANDSAFDCTHFSVGFGGYRMGPGLGYYGGGLSLILTIVLILLLLKVI